VEGKKQIVCPERDYFVPFIQKFKCAIYEGNARGLRSVGEYLIFVDRPTNFESACISEGLSEGLDTTGLVWAPHWYDLVPLVTKSFRSWVGVVRDSHGYSLPVVFGKKNLISEYARQMTLTTAGVRKFNSGKGLPTVLGEIGIPFDLQEGIAFQSGNFDLQTSAMDVTMSALDKSLLSGILWNYTPDNTNKHGDGWNGEDLSIFSQDQQGDISDNDIFSGIRALPAVVRPFVMRCSGTPLSMNFDTHTRIFSFRYQLNSSEDANVAKKAPTVVFVPFFQYPLSPRIEVSEGTIHFDQDSQTLSVSHPHNACSTISVRIFPVHLQEHIPEANYFLDDSDTESCDGKSTNPHNSVL